MSRKSHSRSPKFGTHNSGKERQFEAKNIPSDEAWNEAVYAFFNFALEKLGESILNAFLPIERDKVYEEGGKKFKSINYFPDYEIDQTCTTLNKIKKALDNAQEDRALQLIMRIMMYTQILEADRPYVIMNNIIRMLRGLPAIATFEIHNNGKPHDCIDTRIDMMASKLKDYNLEICDLLKKIWFPKFRNAFVHSQYIILSNDMFVSTRGIAPGSKREDGFGISFEDLLLLHQSTSAYFTYFLHYAVQIQKRFQTGEVFNSQAGPVVFENNWRFVNLPEDASLIRRRPQIR